MIAWSLIDIHPTRGRTFQRPLDALELGFLWEGLFNGTADSIHHFELRLTDGSRDAHLFSDSNIVQAWLSTKRRYPLSGAILYCDNVPFGTHLTELEAANDLTSGPAQCHFVVHEHDLTVLHPNEIVFEQVSCLEEVQKRAPAILLGPRQLSDQLLVRLYVFRETGSERSDILHVMTLMSHCVTDGMASKTFIRCFLDTLARGGESLPIQIPLEERLATTISPSELEPGHLRSLSLARRRWRRAVGHLIYQSRMERGQGGHTLPCCFTNSTTRNPSKSGLVNMLLTQQQSSEVFSNCRSHNVTFGSAYLALAQVAMTRVLYRRYLRGEISDEEWDYRKRQPHVTLGSVNFRPYLDEAWFEGGGAGEFMTCATCYLYGLPFMTLGEESSQRTLSDGAPPFSDLLTFGRFLHRARLVKKQAALFFSHPLFFEIASAAMNVDVERLRLRALEWRKRVKTGGGPNSAFPNAEQDKVLEVQDRLAVFAHTGSSLGNMDPILPFEYPLPPSHSLSPNSPLPHSAKAGYITPLPTLPSVSASDAHMPPKFILEDWSTRLHNRCGGVYLGASTWRGRLKMYAHYDGNVYGEEVVKEWMEELKEAVLWYLGETHLPHGVEGDHNFNNDGAI